jgi:hypothetical protein
VLASSCSDYQHLISRPCLLLLLRSLVYRHHRRLFSSLSSPSVPGRGLVSVIACSSTSSLSDHRQFFISDSFFYYRLFVSVYSSTPSLLDRHVMPTSSVPGHYFLVINSAASLLSSYGQGGRGFIDCSLSNL